MPGEEGRVAMVIGAGQGIGAGDDPLRHGADWEEV